MSVTEYTKKTQRAAENKIKKVIKFNKMTKIFCVFFACSVTLYAKFVNKSALVPSPYLPKTLLFCTTSHFTMKLLSESVRNFFEGFVSFYTSIYHEMKSW